MLKAIIRRFVLSLCVVSLAACASTRPVGSMPGVNVANLSSIPAPAAQDFVSGTAQDIVRPLDKLAVEVFNVPELTREVEVGLQGTFDYPLVGEVRANGLTPAQIASEIEQRLGSGYVLGPQVLVRVTGREGQAFTIGGEVNRPGRYAVAQPITLLEAVALGGGTSEYAKLDDVIVFRQVGGQRYIGVYNLKAIRRGNYENPPVYANDIIEVGDSPNRRALSTLVGLAPLLSTPVILIERLLN